MEREYFAIMPDRYVYLITETSSFDRPVIYVAAYPTGVFADSYVKEYLRQLPNTNALYVNSGVYQRRSWQTLGVGASGQDAPQREVLPRSELSAAERPL